MGNQTELENKFDADEIGSATFCQALFRDDPDLYENRKPYDDIYYKNGDSVVRHRLRGHGELTVKKRKSADSIEDRVEINLNFSKETDREDVHAFLAATGYKRMFTIRKTSVYIFVFRREDYEVEVCRYSCSRIEGHHHSNFRTFIEVEVKRNEGSDYTDTQLKAVLQAWRHNLRSKLHVGEPLNESLLEIYSKPTSPSTGTHYRI